MKKLLLFIVMFFGLNSFALAVDINTATVKELEAIKGIGPGKAKAIVEYRQVNGPFSSVDDLAKVKGFSATSVEKFKGELSVGKKDAKAKKSEHAATPATPATPAKGERGDKSAHEAAIPATPATPAPNPGKGPKK